jgi:hypothetical protein
MEPKDSDFGEENAVVGSNSRVIPRPAEGDEDATSGREISELKNPVRAGLFRLSLDFVFARVAVADCEFQIQQIGSGRG